MFNFGVEGLHTYVAGGFVVHNCHHLSAETFLGPVSATASRYRWGLTATPDRPDGMGFLLDLYLGPRLFSLGPADLVARGFLVLPKVYGVSVDWTPSPLAKRIEGRCPTCRAKVSPSASAVVEGTAKCKAGHAIGPSLWGGAERIRAGDVAGDWDWAAVTAEQFSSPVFLEAIVGLAEAGWREDRTVLVLVPLVDAAERVVSLLRRRAVPCAVVTGAEKKSSRERRLSQVRGGHLPVIVATQLADEGLDVPNLDLLVLASGGRAEGRAIQRVGRVMRPQGAPPIVFDLVTRSEVHLAQWRKRADAYRSVVGASPTGLVSVAHALSSLGSSK